MNMEVYRPPSLYDSSGAPRSAAAPDSAPAQIDIGETFIADFTDAADISRVHDDQDGSVTHSWNMEQRFIELTYVRNGTRLSIQGTDRALPMRRPGFWMLFALNEYGRALRTAASVKINIATNIESRRSRRC
jgi:hypothetical protein